MSFAIRFAAVSITMETIAVAGIKAKKEEGEKSSKRGASSVRWISGTAGAVGALAIAPGAACGDVLRARCLVMSRTRLPARGRSVGVRSGSARTRDSTTTEVIANRIATQVRAVPEVAYKLVTIGGRSGAGAELRTIMSVKRWRNGSATSSKIQDAVSTGVIRSSRGQTANGVRGGASVGGGKQTPRSSSISDRFSGRLEKFRPKCGTAASCRRRRRR